MLLFLASYIFYSFWDWRFCSLILISSLTDFVIGNQLFGEKNQKKRKLLLAISLLVNLGILCFFKYFNFFIQSFEELLNQVGFQTNTTTLNILLPIGISFYTFQTLSYTIDIFRGKIQPAKNWLSFFTFVSFFPQLIAGPIERASRLLPQLEKHRIFSFNQSRSGLQLILWGLFKKVVIADNIARYVDIIFADPQLYFSWSILLAIALFSVQVYCDFSGYSDIAIGSGKLFGINLMTNFRTPFFSKTFKEFWARWHISLSSWFKDYLYIPLGGNQAGKLHWAMAILITFTISGLWHGANISYLLWGFLFGFYYLLEHVTQSRIKIKLPGLLASCLVFTIFSAGFYLFRAENIDDSIILVSHTFQAGTFLSPLKVMDSNREAILVIFSLLILIGIEFIIKKEDINFFFQKLPQPGRWTMYFFLALIILLLGNFRNPEQFVYFQF